MSGSYRICSGDGSRQRIMEIMSSPLDATVPQPDPHSPGVPPAADSLTVVRGQDPSPSPSASARIGRYAILRILGEGGMGVVYAAYDEELDRRVALKLLRGGERANQEQRLRILREAQAMARVSHPNVVNVYEVGEFDGQIYIAMEFVEGTTLSEWQRSARSWEEILRMYGEAGSGLQAAHEAGLVHRDFKPENVLVGRDGRPRVADFGLARSDSVHQAAMPGSARSAPASPAVDLEQAATLAPSSPTSQDSGRLLQSPLTQDGAILGTPAYMSPEQHDGQPADARSDQFSFCAALYEALYRQRPFPGDTLLSLSFNVLHGRLRSPPSNTPVPVRIERALRRGLAVSPAARFPSMQALLQAIEMDLQRDPAAAPLARRVFSIVCLVTICTNTTLMSIWGVRGTLTIRDLLWADLAMLGLAAAVVKWQRRTLLRNAFHRGLVSIILSTLAQTVLVRALGELLALRVEHVLTLDMIMLAGMFGLIAMSYLRGAWALMSLCLLASLAALIPQKIAVLLMPGVYPLCTLGLVWLWSRAASGLRTCKTLDRATIA